ncbi:hypothetical protein ACMD2_20473 [Ananas comosus]|uniref:Uncharacterized protein n=1 Tax=Ananas comosus TaxID=4615 RepID=A0A199V1W4_ANACO|nr:hypothetical protein ACMD2_20473 [Ananas comosus]
MAALMFGVAESTSRVGEALITLEANSALVALSRVIPLRIHFETWILVVDTTTEVSMALRGIRDAEPDVIQWSRVSRV